MTGSHLRAEQIDVRAGVNADCAPATSGAVTSALVNSNTCIGNGGEYVVVVRNKLEPFAGAGLSRLTSGRFNLFKPDVRPEASSGGNIHQSVERKLVELHTQEIVQTRPRPSQASRRLFLGR
jgi:hypothetical protein